MSALAAQRELWSARPRDWAQIAEPLNHELYVDVLDRAGLAPGPPLLDLACGSGYATGLAAARGARVSGVDIAPALLAIARERVPAGDFREADMAALPYADGTFEVVTAVNALQFAADPDRALAEAARVLAPGGRLAVATFAEPERNQGTALHLAMQALITDPPPVRHAPYALSDARALRAALNRAWLADDLGAECERLVAAGLRPFHTGRAGPVRAIWFDGHAWFGHPVEVLARAPELLAFYALLAESAAGWDGRDPLRPAPAGPVTS